LTPSGRGRYEHRWHRRAADEREQGSETIQRGVLMSVIRVGSNGNYAEGWDEVFGKAKAGKAKATGKKTVKKPAKKLAKPAAKTPMATTTATKKSAVTKKKAAKKATKKR
jgi:hypothetical protein